MVTSISLSWFRLPLALSVLVALAACEVTPGQQRLTYFDMDMPVIEEERRVATSATWYAPGLSVDQMSRANAECERQVASVEQRFRRQALEQCMANRGVRAVDLPECSDRVRNAALAAGPSGRTVMPPLAPGACIMTLPSGDQPIISDPSEYV